MYRSYHQRLGRLLASDRAALAQQGLIGLEKESLRVTPQGTIAQTPHPPALGAALTNTRITTDYSEALLELITAPAGSACAALEQLDEIVRFVYANIGSELLWATSMPCVLEGEAAIPIARYGSSNAGIMKYVYRRGLGYRYGKTMQVIAGVHFNYSFATELWPLYAELTDQPAGDLQALSSAAYMALTRNLLRYGWLVPYLFGASPAVCRSFFGEAESGLSEFGQGTLYEPWATSLRLSDIGYQNSKESALGIKPDYNSLAGYVDSLMEAIATPHPAYVGIGVKVDGEYRQLNANRLQIENEYYSTARVKQLTERFEKPTSALRRRGVRYVELRSLDVLAFEPLGVCASQLRFLEALMLFCLLQESPPLDVEGRRAIDHNLQQSAIRGREPGLCLRRDGRDIALRDWAEELCTELQGVCELLDAGRARGEYAAALAAQLDKVRDPDATPSARVLAEMGAKGEGFFDFAMDLSCAHREHFLQRPLEAAGRAEFEALAARSHADQRALEASDDVDFDTFLAHYLASG